MVLAAGPRRPRGDRVPRGRERVHGRRARPHAGVPGAAVRGDPRAGSRRPTSPRRSATARGTTSRARSRAASTRSTAGGPPARGTGEQETVLLDENVLAGDSPYFALGGFAISPSHDLLAYSTDYSGGERYTLRFRDLRTGEDLPDTVEDVLLRARLVRRQPHDLLRAPRRHRAAVPGLAPRARHRRRRRRPRLRGGRRAVLRRRRPHAQRQATSLIVTDSKTTSEVLLPAVRRPGARHRASSSRAPTELEYSSSTTSTPVTATGSSSSRTPTAPRTSRSWSRPVATPGRGQLDRGGPPSPRRAGARPRRVRRPPLVSEREDGLEQLRVRRLADDDEHVIEMPDPVYTVWAGENLEYDDARRSATATRRSSGPRPRSTTTSRPASRRS